MYKNIFFTLEGSLGEFLMILAFLQNLKKEKPEISAVISVKNNFELYKKLVEDMPYITILHSSNIFNLSLFIIGRKFLICSLMTFALKDNLKLKLYKKYLSLISFGKYTEFVYDKVEENFSGGKIFFDFSKLFYHNLSKLSYYFLNSPFPTQPGLLKVSTNNSYLLENYLSPNEYIVFQIFASNKGRTLPLKKWEYILKTLVTKYPNLKIVLNGSNKDTEEIRKLQISENILDSSHISDFRIQAGTILNSKFFIGVDTGPTHAAALFQKKVIYIGNNSNPTWWPTYNPNTKVLVENKNCTCDGKKRGNCYLTIDNVKYYRCMYEIDVEKIMSEIIKNL